VPSQYKIVEQGNKGTYNAVLDLEALSKKAVDLSYRSYRTLKHKKETSHTGGSHR
jgi:hypothetical protein